MDEQSEIKHFVRVTILELLRMNEVEEAIEVELAYQKLYPNSRAYFPDIEYTQFRYLIENGAHEEHTPQKSGESLSYIPTTTERGGVD